jgi:hypothetical protein
MSESPASVDEESKIEDEDPVANRKQSPVSSDSPIVYHYLTFDTILPEPTRHAKEPETPPPPEPNLRKYDNPFDWSPTRKQAIIWLSCIATLFTAYAAGCYEAGIPQMTVQWHVSETAATVGITIFTCGFAIAPSKLSISRGGVMLTYRQ